MLVYKLYFMVSLPFASQGRGEILIYLSLLRKSSMNKAVVIAVIAMLVLLAACGNKQMQAKPLKTPNGAVVGLPAEPTPTTAPEPEPAPTKTAAEALKEFEEQQLTSGTTGAKQGSTGMPPAPTGVTGLDALKARTKSLYKTGSGIGEAVDADREFGSRFDDLPDDYGNDGSAGE